MDSNIAIKVDHVSKKYCKSLKQSMIYGVSDILRNSVGLSSNPGNLRKQEFWALDDVSFDLKKGETLGIIGPNGSGKTTLLKMLNGIFWPDKGKITVHGRVGALIEVGAGFHPLLTGRENIYVNGAILGMNKQEIDKKFDAIVEFADIGDFLDTPVKFYSSGMFVRLGFAIAVHCEPDILLIDEVLAVGDVQFQNRCLNKINELKDYTTVVFVSHNLNSVRLMTDRCMLLEKSKCIKIGESRDILEAYSYSCFGNFHGSYAEDNLKIDLIDQNGHITDCIEVHQKCSFVFNISNLTIKKGLLFAVAFNNLSNNYSYRVEIKKFSEVKNKLNKFSFIETFNDICLPPGEYTMRFAISDGEFINRVFYRESTVTFRIVETDKQSLLSSVTNEFKENYED